MHTFIIFTFSFLIIIICIVYNIKYVRESFQNKNYYKCSSSKIRGITKDIFQYNNIHLNDDKNWDIYMPCGYNNVETELKHINPINSNQIIFGISGCDKIVSKNNIWNLLMKSYGRKKSSTIMPNTYILDNNEDIQLLKLNFIPGTKYILKKNLQRKQGLLMSNNLDVILNSKSKGYKIAQHYLTNVFLINKRKINLRIYIVIKCIKNELKAYMHKEGKCIYTNKDYDPSSLDFESNITSYNLELDIYKINPLTFSELKDYFKQHNLDYTLLFEKIKHILYLTIKASRSSLCKLKNISNNTTFQLFGIDVVFDNNLNPYLLEFNKGPDMEAKNKVDYSIKKKVLEDMFDLVHIIHNPSNQFIQIY